MKADKKLARKRIDTLFEQASENPERADRYVDLARKIAMKAQISMPTAYRRLYCHNCYAYHKEAKRRMRLGVLIITCSKCGHVDRFPAPKK
jgi:ribonuclease P protein subunit RPR2